MFDEEIFNAYLEEYKDAFADSQWPYEKYKWEAIKCFRDNWDIDAADFADMLGKALAKTDNLLTAYHYFPHAMIMKYAEADPETVRGMFRDLFDESMNLDERRNLFIKAADDLFTKYSPDDVASYQNANSTSVYLWLRYPDKYYIYKYGVVKSLFEAVDSDLPIKRGDNEANIKNCYAMFDAMQKLVVQDQELISLFKSMLTEDCYNDPEYRTLTMDVGVFISNAYKQAQEEEDGDAVNEDGEDYTTEDEFSDEEADKQYWFLNANPAFWSISEMPVGQSQVYTLYNENGNKRRIFQNFLDAKVGDIVIGYESQPVMQIVAILMVDREEDGKTISFKKLEDLAAPIDYLALKENPALADLEYIKSPRGSLFYLGQDEYEAIMAMIREAKEKEPYTKDDFLKEVYINETQYDELKAVLQRKLNIILQGAPGVGKTFAAKRLAYSIMGKKDDDRIEFIQFHQNYSYEDFVMGYKPNKNGGFDLENGVFYKFCEKARNDPDPKKPYFFIIDEINRGNMSKIFGELLMLIEKDYRKESARLAYKDVKFQVPENLYIIGMMNTADRSLAMIDYALRRRFGFFDMEPGFDKTPFKEYMKSIKALGDNKFKTALDELINVVIELNKDITKDLGKGFCIGHSYFCGIEQEDCTVKYLQSIAEYDILPTLREYWFDDADKVTTWENEFIEIGMLPKKSAENTPDANNKNEAPNTVQNDNNKAEDNVAKNTAEGENP